MADSGECPFCGNHEHVIGCKMERANRPVTPLPPLSDAQLEEWVAWLRDESQPIGRWLLTERKAQAERIAALTTFARNEQQAHQVIEDALSAQLVERDVRTAKLIEKASTYSAAKATEICALLIENDILKKQADANYMFYREQCQAARAAEAKLAEVERERGIFKEALLILERGRS